jgi:hypothetical protein
MGTAKQPIILNNTEEGGANQVAQQNAYSEAIRKGTGFGHQENYFDTGKAATDGGREKSQSRSDGQNKER